jgi:hypothetical protein
MAGPHASDTSPDAAAVVDRCIRELAPIDRLRKGCSLSNRGRRLGMAAIRRQHPSASELEVKVRYLELAYGRDLAEAVRHWIEERPS